jgi:hypothetical protein
MEGKDALDPMLGKRCRYLLNRGMGSSPRITETARGVSPTEKADARD